MVSTILAFLRVVREKLSTFSKEAKSSSSTILCRVVEFNCQVEIQSRAVRFLISACYSSFKNTIFFKLAALFQETGYSICYMEKW